MENGLSNRMGNILSQAAEKINHNWVLLDSESTIVLFCNAKLLRNIRKVNVKLKISATPVKNTTMVGELKGYGTV